MDKILLIARHEYIINLRRLRFILFTLSVPVLGLIGILTTLFFGQEASNLITSQFIPDQNQVGIVDMSGELLPVLPEYEDEITAYESETTGREALEAAEIGVLYIFPPDFIESGRVVVVRAEEGSAFDADSFLVEEYVSARLLDERLEGDLRRRVLNPITDSTAETLAGEATGSDGDFSVAGDFIVPYAFALLLSISVFSSSGYLLGGVAEEKGNRVVEMLLSSVTAGQLLTGKVLGLGALGLTRVGFWVGSLAVLGSLTRGLTGGVLADLVPPGLLILALVYYILGFLMYAVLLGAGGALGGTVQESQQIGGFLSIFAAFPLYLLAFTVTNPNATIARVFSWFPLTAPTTMIVRLPFGNIPTIDIVGSIVVCVLFLPVIIWAGARVFRAGLLSYGNRPNLREIVKIIVQGG